MLLVLSLLILVVSFCPVAVKADCTATATPPGLYTADVGNVNSYPVGKNPGYRNSFDNCTWIVECPAGTNFTIENVKYWSYNSQAYLRVHDLQSESVLKTYSTLTKNAVLFTNASRVELNFIAISGSTYGSIGFSLDYVCTRGTCAARTVDGVLVDGKELSAPNGTIHGDGDGVTANVRLLSNQTCSFTIKCPAEQPYLALRYRMLYSANSLLTIDNVTYADPNRAQFNEKGFQLAGPTLSAGIPIQFVSNTTNNFDMGYWLEYACHRDRCTSETSGSSASAATGFFLTDVDGVSINNYYAPGEVCTWSALTPGTTQPKYVYYAVDSVLSRGANITVVLRPTNEVLFKRLMGLSNSRFGVTAVGTVNYTSGMTLEFLFNTADGDLTNPAYGATFWYAFRDSPCSSETSGTLITEPSGEILTDWDGSGNAHMAANEFCDWRVACPAGRQAAITLQFYGSMSTNTFLVMDEEKGNEIILEASSQSSAAASYHTVYASKIRIAVNTSSGFPVRGATIRYSCLAEPSCTSPNATAFPAVPNGTLVTDFDGDKTAVYTAANLSCTWSLSCPDSLGSRFIRINQKGDFYDGNISGLLLNGTEVFNVHDLRDEKGPLFIPADEGQLSIVGESRMRAGSSFMWQCQYNMCPVNDNTTLNEASGSFTTYESTRHRYVAGERCSWRVRCPAGYDYINFRTTCRRASVNDTFTARNATSGEVMSDLCRDSASTTRSYSFKEHIYSTDVIIAWEAVSDLRTGFGISTLYECQRYTCSTERNQTTVTAMEGKLLSDVDGAGSGTKQRAGDYCSQLIICPDGSPYVSMSVKYTRLYPSSASLDKLSFRIGDVEMPATSSMRVYGVLVRTVAGTVPVVFDLLTEASTVDHEGYEINFQCRHDPCPTLLPRTSTNLWAGSITTERYTAAYRSPGLIENCSWSVTCPQPSRYLDVDDGYISPTKSENTGYSVTVGSETLASVNNTQYVGSTQTRISERRFNSTETLHMNIGFNSSVVGLQSVAADLPWACSSCSYQHQTYYRNPSSRSVIKSDSDGYRTLHKSVPGDSCFWHLECSSPGYQLMVENFRADFGSNKLRVYHSISRRSELDPAVMPEIAAFTGYIARATFIFNSSSIFLQYNVSESAAGFEGTFYCHKMEPCDGITIVGEHGFKTFITDTDGAGPKRLTSGSCRVPIECPDGKQTLQFSGSFKLRGTTAYVEGNYAPDSVGDLQFYKMTSGSMAGILLPNWSVVLHRWRSYSSGNLGVTFNYSCSSRGLCTSSKPSNQQQLLPACPDSLDVPCQQVSFTTDRDNAVDLSRIEQCDWPLRCPSNQFIKAVALHPAGDDSTASSASGFTVDLKTKTKLYRLSSMIRRNVFVPSNEADLSFDATETDKKSLRIRAECSRTRCDADESQWHKSATGMIYFGANSASPYSGNANCTFVVRCPANYDGLHFKCNGAFSNRNDGPIRFDILQPVAGNPNAYTVKTTNTASISIPSSRQLQNVTAAINVGGFVRLRFMSLTSTYANTAGTGCNYVCMNTANLPTTPTASTPRPPSQPSTTPSPPSPSFQPQGPGPQGAPLDSSGSSDGSFVGGIAGGVIAAFVLIAGITALAIVMARNQNNANPLNSVSGDPFGGEKLLVDGPLESSPTSPDTEMVPVDGRDIL